MNRAMWAGLIILGLGLTLTAGFTVWQIYQMQGLPEKAETSEPARQKNPNLVNDKILAADLKVAAFAAELKSTLISAMKTGGPVNAIAVCSKTAPDLAKLHSQEGFLLRRTTLKVRNIANTPDSWERRGLEMFTERQAAGVDMSDAQIRQTGQENGRPNLRYLKPILMAEPCLACHGTNIAPEVQAKLDELYPEDQATGYKLGDVRGAFSVVMELD